LRFGWWQPRFEPTKHANKDCVARTSSGILGGEDSLLSRIIRRIIKDERRHFAFYFAQARKRLHAPAAQRLTNFLLRRFWEEVGRSVRGSEDAQRICSVLFSNEVGLCRLTAIDTAISRLPGLEWFDLASRRCAAK
jgi:hypothetical protein